MGRLLLASAVQGQLDNFCPIRKQMLSFVSQDPEKTRSRQTLNAMHIHISPHDPLEASGSVKY